MNKSIIVLTMGFSLLTLNACTTWTKEKCLSTNWDNVGYSEGSQGKPHLAGLYADRCEKQKTSINSQAYDQGYDRGLKQFCSSHRGHQDALSGLALQSLCAPLDQYQSGYQNGLKIFCTHEHGYNWALQGKSQNNYCSGKSQSQFLSGYTKGRKTFVVNEIKALEQRLYRTQKDLDEVRDKIADTQYEIERIPKYTNEESVIRLREDKIDDLESLMSERDSLRSDIESMERRLISLERELQ